MAFINKAINAVKDAYLYVINGIANHPHITFAVGIVVIVLGIRF